MPVQDDAQEVFAHMLDACYPTSRSKRMDFTRHRANRWGLSASETTQTGVVGEAVSPTHASERVIQAMVLPAAAGWPKSGWCRSPDAISA